MTTTMNGRRYSTASQDYMAIENMILDCNSGTLHAATELALGSGGVEHAICLEDAPSCLKYRAGEGVRVWINGQVAERMGVLQNGQKMRTEVDGQEMLTAEYHKSGRRK